MSELVADLGDRTPRTVEQVYLHRDEAVTIGEVAYFLNDDGVHGRELWRSDGTLEGTTLVRDLCPGSCGTVWITGDRQIARLGERIVVSASDGQHGFEIFLSDGTAEGTELLRDIRPGFRSSWPRGLITVGARVYFAADDGVHGTELWYSDGTGEGTLRVPDVPLGTDGFAFEGAVDLDGLLVTGGSSGLWRSDGTSIGTFRLADVSVQTPGGSRNAPFQILGDRLYFTAAARDPDSVPVLWASDGTIGGTAEFLPGAEWPFHFARSSTALFFETDDRKIWRTDGTSEGTIYASFPVGVFWSGVRGQVETIGEVVVFPAWDDAHGREPWASDGASVWPLGDLRPGTASSLAESSDYFASSQTFFKRVGDRVVFLADDGAHGLELWSTDGQAAGTGRMPGVAPVPSGGSLDSHQTLVGPYEAGDDILFRTRETDGSKAIWRSDGSKKGTVRVRTLDGQTSALSPRSEGASLFENLPIESCFTPLRGGLLFAASNAATGHEPWFSGGEPASTKPVADLDPGANGWTLLCRALAGSGIITSYPDGEQRLFGWRGEGEEAEFLAETGGGSVLLAWSDFRGALFFTAGGLWTTDGTPGGTFAIEPDLAGFSPFELEPVGDLLFVSGTGLAVTTGAAGALEQLTPEAGDSSVYPERLTAFGSDLLFFGGDPDHGFELWRSDGTPSGTTRAADIRAGPSSSIHEESFGSDRPFLSRIVELGPVALFAADDGFHGEELWVSDGTENETRLLFDLAPGSYPSVPRELVRMGELVYFTAEVPEVGRELWVTDGTAAGTSLVADLVPGPGSSVLEHLTVGTSALYFSAWTPERGREAWRLRPGDSPALAPLAEIAPGPLSSSPEAFLEVGGAVYTVANDNLRGFELWKLREEHVLFTDGFEGTTTEVWTVAVP